MNMPTFLVVDDDPAIRMMYGRSLAGLGDVQEADGGRHAISLINARSYDAVVLDLHMPGSDGFAVLEALAKEEALNRETPVFVVTGDMSGQARVRALKLRSLLFLTKPVPLAMLKSLVETALQKKSANASRSATPAGSASISRPPVTPTTPATPVIAATSASTSRPPVTPTTPAAPAGSTSASTSRPPRKL